jgi:NADH:ubiquinone oxidoreductase subunit 4 (subunit M)
MWLLSMAAVLVTIGFPGTSLFWAKYVFFVGLVPTLPGLATALAALFLVFLPIFFIRLWAMVWFGFRSEPRLVLDLNLREVFVLSFAIGLGLLLGLMPGLVFWNLSLCS